MGLRIAFGTTGDATQQFVNPLLAQRLQAFSATAGRGIDYTNQPTTDALENVAGTYNTDLYRDVAATDFTATYAIANRWGIAVDRTNGIATFDLKSGWNLVKNVSVVSDVADQVVLDGFVHVDADYSQVTTGVNSLDVIGTKSGNILGAQTQDVISIALLTNINRTTGTATSNNAFHVATSGGNDFVSIDSFDFSADPGDTTFTQGQFLRDQADNSGRFTTTFVDLGTGNDNFIDATLAADSVWGGSGNDSIVTGGGNDYLDGGVGNDFLSGGTGADTFHFSSGYGRDTVSDFSRSEGDKLEFSPGIFASQQAVLDSAYQRGGDVWIDPGNDGVGDIIILKNMVVSQLMLSDIVIQ